MSAVVQSKLPSLDFGTPIEKSKKVPVISKAAKKRERKQTAIVEANEKALERRPEDPALVMHDDNAAMIQVFRTGTNPTMRTLGRVFWGFPVIYARNSP